MENKTTRLLAHRKTIKARKPRFLRTDWHKISNLGLRRESEQVWRKPKGRHNKIREKKKGHIKNPSVGYRSPKLVRGTIEGLMPVLVRNVQDLKKVTKNNIAIIASVGLKKKIEIAKKAEEMKINIMLNTKKFLKEAEKRIAQIKQKKEGKEKKESKEKEKTETKEKMPEKSKEQGKKEEISKQEQGEQK